jgi:pilus assembly protein CpaE
MATQFSLVGSTNKTSIAVTTVGLDPISCRTLANLMEGVPGAAIAANIDGYSGAEREVGRAGDKARLRICFIDYDQNIDQAIWTTEHLRTNYPDVHIFAVSAHTEPERIIAAMRVGCTEYLVKPIQSDRVMDGLTRVEAKQKERMRSKVHGKVTTVIGAKGGAGVTSLALHLALELTGKEQRKCLLVDQHAALGDASLYLGAGRHQYSFYELANNTDRLDQELLQGFLLRHSSGLHVLDSPETVDVIHMASPSAVEHTLSFLAETYQFVVVDCPPGLSDLNLACISQSDEIAIVMTAELPSVRNAVRYMEHLERLGYNSRKIQIVLNRHCKRGPLSDERIEKALGRQISLRIPNNYNEVIRAINSGAPIPSGKTEFGSAIQKWAREISSNANGETAMAAAQSRAGGVRSLFGK